MRINNICYNYMKAHTILLLDSCFIPNSDCNEHCQCACAGARYDNLSEFYLSFALDYNIYIKPMREIEMNILNSVKLYLNFMILGIIFIVSIIYGLYLFIYTFSHNFAHLTNCVYGNCI